MAPPGVDGPEHHYVSQHHRAVHDGGVDIGRRVDVHDPGQAHDPAVDQPAGGRPAHRAQPRALDNHVGVDVHLGRVPGVVMRAQPFDQVALEPPGCQVHHVHLIAALDTQKTSQ